MMLRCCGVPLPHLLSSNFDDALGATGGQLVRRKSCESLSEDTSTVSNFSLESGSPSLLSLAEKLRQNWLEKTPDVKETDDSLTNLTWLYDLHPMMMDPSSPQLSKITVSGFDLDSGSSAATPEVDLNQQQQQLSMETQQLQAPRLPPMSHDNSNAGSLFDPLTRQDFRTNWTGKPPFSYATMICMAMRELGKPKITLSDIYGWITDNFIYYRHSDSSWQNSVRHNLSLNKCFEKVPRNKGERGKGGFWRINAKYADVLEANLARSRRNLFPAGCGGGLPSFRQPVPPPEGRPRVQQQLELYQQRVARQPRSFQQNSSAGSTSSCGSATSDIVDQELTSQHRAGQPDQPVGLHRHQSVLPALSLPSQRPLAGGASMCPGRAAASSHQSVISCTLPAAAPQQQQLSKRLLLRQLPWGEEYRTAESGERVDTQMRSSPPGQWLLLQLPTR